MYSLFLLCVYVSVVYVMCCVYMYKHVHMSADACRVQRRMSEPLELHSQAV